MKARPVGRAALLPSSHHTRLVRVAWYGRKSMTHGIEGRKRWYALMVLCLGVLMIVLDTTIVNVALPSIRADLDFTETSLVWVVNAYMLTFGGFLLLGGRLGDLYGHRRMFLAGLALFTLASLACGMAHTREFLIARARCRAWGARWCRRSSLSLVMNLFTEAGRSAPRRWASTASSAPAAAASACCWAAC